MRSELLDYAVARLHENAAPRFVPCKMCGSETTPFDVVDRKGLRAVVVPAGLTGVPVYYRICPDCQFIFTDFFDAFTGEQWRRHIYNDEYAKVDPDYREARRTATPRR